MPAAKVFLDTNTLLYLRDRNAPAKSKIAHQWFLELIRQQGAQINLQVLNEATNAMIRKRWFESPRQVYAIVDDFAELGDAPVGWNDIVAARTLHFHLHYSWWDCLLLASALELGCTHFLSEDLQDGQVISDGSRSLTIVNPFAHSPEHILTQ